MAETTPPATNDLAQLKDALCSARSFIAGEALVFLNSFCGPDEEGRWTAAALGAVELQLGKDIAANLRLIDRACGTERSHGDEGEFMRIVTEASARAGEP